MLLKSIREYEDTLYFKKYSADEDRVKLENILANLRRQLADQT
jgi:hypothetical protein